MVSFGFFGDFRDFRPYGGIFDGMNELRLDKGTHDISLSGGGFRRISGADARSGGESVAQRVLCMLRTELGEAFTDPEYGTPWFGEVLGLPVSHLDLATKILREKISAVPGVERVAQIRLKVDGRNMSGTFRIVCTGGSTATGEFQ